MPVKSSRRRKGPPVPRASGGVGKTGSAAHALQELAQSRGGFVARLPTELTAGPATIHEGHVRADPACPRKLTPRESPGHGDNLLHPPLFAQGFEQACAHVSAGAGDHDPHEPRLPGG